jgi:hypothetical protein
LAVDAIQVPVFGADSVGPAELAAFAASVEASADRNAAVEPAFVINGIGIDMSVAETAVVSPAVVRQLSVDECARSLVITDSRITSRALPHFSRLLSGCVIAEPSYLGQLCEKLENPSLEQQFVHPPDCGNDSTDCTDRE